MQDQNPYSPPAAEISADQAMPGQATFPGLRRLPYFLWSIALGVGFVILMAIGGAIAGATNSPEAMIIVMAIGYIALFVVAIILGVKRLNNLGTSGAWILLMFVPIVSIGLSIFLIAFPEGYTKHRTLDTAAKVIIGIFVAFIVLAILGGVLGGMAG
jgi:uncharacterized membrane protein YhaH (DUF805 family)